MSTVSRLSIGIVVSFVMGSAYVASGASFGKTFAKYIVDTWNNQRKS